MKSNFQVLPQFLNQTEARVLTFDLYESCSFNSMLGVVVLLEFKPQLHLLLYEMWIDAELPLVSRLLFLAKA